MSNRATRLAAIAAVLALSACAIPRGGPSVTQVTQNAQGVRIVPIKEWLPSDVASTQHEAVIPPEFLFVQGPSTDVLQAGDRLNITIAETSSNGSFLQSLPTPFKLDNILVEQDGTIRLPFAGSLNALGLTPVRLEERISAQAQTSLYKPQVHVSRIGGEARAVTVLGDFASGRRVDLNSGTSRLTAVLATADQKLDQDASYTVAVNRGGLKAEIPLECLRESPDYDLTMQPGDIVTLSKTVNHYTVLGSVGQNDRKVLPPAGLSLIEAIGLAGGLNEKTADPSAVFLFRRQASAAAPKSDLVAYRVDMNDPSNFFAAGEFPLRNGDIIYVSYARFTQIEKVLRAVGNVASYTRLVETIP